MSLRDMKNLPEATPALNEKEAERFLAQVEKGLKHPTGPRPTPRLKEARRIALEAERGRKLLELQKQMEDAEADLVRRANRVTIILAAGCFILGGLFYWLIP